MAEPTRCSVKCLRAALKAWDDAPALGEHELCSWRIAAARRRASGYEDTPAGRGLALRELLEAAIHDLRPEAGEPQPDDPRWRNYRILQGRYLDGRSPDYLAEALAIARSTYNHAQLEAEKALLARLIEWEEGQPAQESAVHRDDAAGAERPRPFMAPPRRPKGLTGREALFEQLRRSLVSAPGKQLALWGLPGVGKTALAVELAHDPAVREAFPGGVLWAGFGASPDLAVLQHLLASALGVPHELLAALDRLEDRARLIQHAVAGRSMLVVLDDIWREEHALAFHLGGETCALLITTRSPGLVQSLPEYEPVEVPELTLEASLRLLEQFAPGAVRARRAMLGEAIERIGGLPLTMVLVGGFLRRETYADQPRRLADALGKLREVENWGRVVSPVSPLDSRPGLEAGAELSLFGVIGLSEQALEARARAALRSLASFPPGPATFSEELALATVGGKGEDLDLLVDAGLLEAAGDDRYRLHSAVWHYLASQDVDRERQIHFVGVVLAWMMAHSVDPRTYEAEAASIQAAIEIASQVAMISELAGLAHRYFQYQKRAGLLEQALRTLRLAFTGSEGGDYPRIRLMLSLDCGQACQRTGDYAGADRFYAEALHLARGLDEPDSHCAALQGLGSTALSQGDLSAAGARFREGLQVAEAADLGARQAGFLSNLGTLAVSQGDRERARQHFEAGLALASGAGDPAMTMALLSNLGTVHAGAGERQAAQAAFQRALELAQEQGDRLTKAALLTNLGTLAHEQGQDEGARKAFEEALELARGSGDRARTSQLLANLGALMTAAGAFKQAEGYLKEGIAIAEGIGHREHVIQLRINLAELEFARNHTRAGMDILRQAAGEAGAIQHRRYSAIIAEMLASREGTTSRQEEDA